jgi:diguanylate cyclase (GGDEF)-like protein
LLDAYVGLVCAAGVAALLVTIALTPWTSLTAEVAPLTIAVFVVAAIAGEGKPLYISRAQESATVSISAPFILALVATGGAAAALLTQALASMGDDLVNRRELKKSAFNIAQYSLSVLLGRVVFASMSGHSLFGGPEPFRVEDLPALLVAGVAMVLLNRLLVATVISVAVQASPLAVLKSGARFELITQTVLISIGAVAALIAEHGTAILLLLAAPVVAVYLTTDAAMRHSHQAWHDSLTDLGNRDNLNRTLVRALERSPGRVASLILIDLDHFKDINDSLGHPVGDTLLREVARRVTTALGADYPTFRLGGDEFAVVVEGGLDETQTVARRALDALEAPMRVGVIELLIRASAGVAVGPEHGDDPQTLMKNADIALYQAKLERDGVCVYTPEYDINILAQLQLLADLRAAIDSGELTVAYQPQVELATGRTVGLEALIRWEHPERGPVPPDSFIPLAENSGMIAAVTAYVLDDALTTVAAWRAAGHHVRMAVNLSARHLSDVALPRQVADALARHAVPAEALVLEVTETGILADPVRAHGVLASLRRLGVAIAVDDYGTGHASLSYLKRLEIDELKVDKSFVSDMSSDRNDFIIVRSTIALARDLGLRVVAEGVEDAETMTVLRELGCDVGQGFHLGRPTTAGAVLDRLEGERLPHPRRPHLPALPGA